MSLALAIRGSDGLVMASDSRVTGPGGRQDTSEKFLQVSRDTGVLTYGAARPGYGGITRLVEETKEHKYSTFDEIAKAAKVVFGREFEDWLEKVPEQERARPLVGFILGGYDHVKTNRFRIVSYESSSKFDAREIEISTFAAARWHISQYLFNKFYYPEMTVKQLAEFAVFVLLETATVEETVGGPIQLATVTLSEGFQRLHADDIQRLIERNQERIASFRQLLLGATLQMGRPDYLRKEG